MRVLPILCFLCIPFLGISQQVDIIPKPASMKLGKGSFELNNKVQIAYSPSVENAGEFFSNYLKQYYNLECRLSSSENSLKDTRTIYLLSEPGAAGHYTLTIEQHAVYIKGDEAGVFYGVQTLIQLLPIQNLNSKIQIPILSIVDSPRFAWRGMHLDVSRHFFSVDYVKKYLDYLALHKMNYFHWHLTDDQGWRIEIKKYPRLTEVGAWREGTIIGRYPGIGNDHIRYGGFYTQEEIKEVVDYAAKRYITVIPEIDIPGHSLALLAAYPQLGTTPDSGYTVAQTWGINDKYNNVLNPTEYTFSFLQDVFDEIIPLFPGPYIHIGGDEVSKQWWKENAFAQQLIKDKGLKDEHGLQSYFIQRIERYINSKGKKIIGWDEILEGGLAPNAVVMSWRGESGGIAAAKQNHYVIMTPESPLYFNHSQTRNEDSITQGGYNPLEAVYNYEPISKGLNAEQGKYVLGAQGNVWSEYIGTPSKLEYSIFPRMSALSEVLWSKKSDRNWKDFEKRLKTQFKRYKLWGANYSKSYFDLKATILPGNNNRIIWKLESKLPNQLADVTQMNQGGYDRHNFSIARGKLPLEISIVASDLYTASLVNYSTSLSQEFHFNKATGRKITLVHQPDPKYPGDGAFTLINGVQNETGLQRSTEFLGFLGADCEAIIDLGKKETISKAKVHILNSPPSWIWRPQSAEIFSSDDGKNFKSIGLTDDISPLMGNAVMEINFKVVAARYIKLLLKNWGEIPGGNPGAGTPAWLFVDEIELE